MNFESSTWQPNDEYQIKPEDSSKTIDIKPEDIPIVNEEKKERNFWDGLIEILQEEKNPSNRWVQLEENKPKVFILNGASIVRKRDRKTRILRAYIRLFLVDYYTREEKWLDTRSISLLQQLKDLDIKKGDMFSLKKTGRGSDTRYTVFKP